MLIPAAVRRLLLLAGLGGAAMSPAHAGGVVMLSGPTATEGRVEAGLAFPDGGGIDANALAVAARALGARDDSTIVWYPDAGIAQRLEELPPDQRVIYSCLTHDSEIYDRGVRALTRPAPAGLDPSAWVAARSGRIVWWPAAPESVACGVPIAVLDATPASLDFGDVLLGDSVQVNVVLSNIGRIDLQLRTIGVEGPGFSLVQNPCNGEQLAPGEGCTLRVGYTPATAGAHVGRVLLPNTGTPPDAELPLAGRGVVPAQLDVDPATVAFGDVVVGATPRRTIAVSNGGGAPLMLGTMSASGAGFSIVANSCDGATLAAAQACSVEIEFAPGASGAFAGAVRVARAGTGGFVDVSLSGRGLAPAQLVVTPTIVAFGDVVVGAALRRSVVVSNAGEAALPIGMATLTGDEFSVSSNACDNVVLAAAETCAIEIEFAPGSATAHSGVLGIARADAGAAVDVAMSGTGLAPARLTIDPTSIAFGDLVVGASLRRVITLGNSGDASLTLGTMVISGTSFSITANACDGMSLAAAQTCAIDVEFQPAGAAVFAGALGIVRAAGATTDVMLSGRGLSPASLQVSPLDIAFGDVPVGQSERRVVTLTNGGDVALVLGNASAAGNGYAIATDACSGVTLAAAQACDIAVDFAPAAAAASSGTLSLPHGGGDTVTVPLQGVGTAPPGALIFRSGFEQGPN